MSVTNDQRAVVESYLQAMQAGADGEDKLLALFADDATYVEPFSGQPRSHTGKTAIRQNLQESRPNTPPDMKLSLDRLDLEGGKLVAEWTCTSPALPGPMKGRDFYELRDGLIARLETTLVGFPGQ